MTDQEYKTVWQNEPDAQELSEMANDVRGAYAHKNHEAATPNIDVEKEWKQFQSKHLQTSPAFGWRRWVVAASLLLLFGIGIALGWPYLKEWKLSKRQIIENTVILPQSDSFLSEDSTQLVFENAELKSILNVIANLHDTKVDYRCKEELFLYVKLEKSWSLKECIDFLNHFERVNLSLTEDNTIVAQ